jgi:hypothetical protein
MPFKTIALYLSDVISGATGSLGSSYRHNKGGGSDTVQTERSNEGIEWVSDTEPTISSDTDLTRELKKKKKKNHTKPQLLLNVK